MVAVAHRWIPSANPSKDDKIVHDAHGVYVVGEQELPVVVPAAAADARR